MPKYKVILILGFVSLVNSEINASPVGKCEKDWTRIGHRCFHHFPYVVDFYKAQFFCRNVGATLASIHSEEEQKPVVDLVNKLNNEKVALGGFRFSENQFMWDDGTSWDFDDWRNEEPNNLRNNENCLELTTPDDNRTWNDISCDDQRSFLCVKSARYVHN